MKQRGFITLEREKELLSKRIIEKKSKHRSFFSREDYGNYDFVKYFWSNYRKYFPIKLLTLSILFVLYATCVFIIGYDFYLFSITSNITLLINPIASIAVGIIVGFMFLKVLGLFFGLDNEFRVKYGFIILSLLLGFTVLTSYFGFENYQFELELIVAYIIPYIIFYSAYKRLLGPGILHMHSIALLVDLDHHQIWDRYSSQDICMVLRGWDEWISKALGLRIKNIGEVCQAFHKRLLFDLISFQKDLRELFSVEFFSLLKDYTDYATIYKVSEKLQSLIEIEVELTPDNIALSVRRNRSSVELVSIAIGVVSGIFGLIMPFL